jgi:hypothetical protein
MGSGAALAVYAVSGVSMRLALALALAAGVFSVSTVWHRSDAEGRHALGRLLKTGVIAGLIATLAYDISRWTLVGVFGLSTSPFAALPLFGQVLIGSDVTPAITFVVGFLYHALNGISFATAYTVLFGHSGPIGGVLWALCLEVAMLAIYPGLLDIRSIGEFTSISMFGHVMYGSALGWSARLLLAHPAT